MIEMHEVENVKDYLFDLWEKTYQVAINDIVFDTEKINLAYDYETDIMEIYLSSDTHLENVLGSFNVNQIKTINNAVIVTKSNF
jgi:hypothetical protein|nr:MAG TPA: hypothetical protein [Caudoviricetes sp.]